jgi:hypothetical protein
LQEAAEQDRIYHQAVQVTAALAVVVVVAHTTVLLKCHQTFLCYTVEVAAEH